MARNYPGNTQIQRFLEEAYAKERETRLNWFAKKMKNEGKGSGGYFTKSKQIEVFKRKNENAPKSDDLTKKLPKDTNPRQYHKCVKKFDDTLAMQAGEESNGLLTVAMRPVTPSVQQTLYNGFTKEGKGRYQYLCNRNHKSPEEKFQFPIISSWEYGWKLGDVIRKEDIKKPTYGRTRIVAATFYTRTGIPKPATAP